MESAASGGARLRACSLIVLFFGALSAAHAQTVSLPEIFGNPPTEVTALQPYMFLPTTTLWGTGELSFEIENKPAWAWFDPMWGRLDGVPAETDVGQYEDIRITLVSAGARFTLPGFGITVYSPEGTHNAVLTWTPPTTNDDSSALTDLAGYRIYGGESAETLRPIAVLPNPRRSRYSVTSFLPGLRHFALSAVSATGVEGPLSAVISALSEQPAILVDPAVVSEPPPSPEPAIFPDLANLPDPLDP